MSQRMPDRLDPWRFADLGKEISGQSPLDSLPRLSACLLDRAGEVAFDLHFQRDLQRRATLTGVISAVLVLECQRCLEAVDLPVETEMAIAFVEGYDQAAQLPEELDPCMVEDGQVQFMDLIEDELLLMLPQVAMHEPDVCQKPLTEMADEKPAVQDAQTGENPFAVLSELKREK
ncbi:MAG: DUF177 domain-containing protein [Candidatus Thiodiazotropha sp. (ex Monitilora ramsayi)]|nr:DUF177 domain-containing protein [Candidatus Thiodiazotropha sp. (ex Monitilora ramsayi)]